MNNDKNKYGPISDNLQKKKNTQVIYIYIYI